jgi:transcriptional regulator with XRE-family HTH domain
MIEENLGDALRQIRARQHLSLRTLAERTGFSPSFLSQVENGQSSPSIASIERITRALGVTLGQFFQAIEPQALPSERARKEWEGNWLGSQIEQLAVSPDGCSLAGFVVTLEPGDASGKNAHISPFDEFAYVQDGAIQLSIETEQHVLGPGDAILIQAGRARRWENTAPTATRILLVSNFHPSGRWPLLDQQPTSA